MSRNMSDTSVVAAVHITTTSKEAREKIYGLLHDIVEYARVQEPDTLKYAICVPDDETAETTIYTFEEYASKAAWNTHMTSEPATKLLKLIETEPSLTNPEISVKHLSWVPDAFLSRDSRLPSGTSHDLRSRVEHPYVLWATITDPDTADIEKLAPYGAAVVKYARENEPDTIFYSDARPNDLTPKDTTDNAVGGFIAALEVYATKEACFAHLQDETVKALAVEGKRLDSVFTIVRMNMVEGWLTRDS